MASNNATFYDSGVSGALFAPLKKLFTMVAVMLALLLAAWIIDWIFVFRVWPDGLERLQVILNEDLARAAPLSIGQYDVTQFATRTANAMYEGIFGSTGIHDMGLRFASENALSVPDTIVRNVYIRNHQAILTAMIGTQLFGVRLALLITALPLILLVYTAAAADGLVQRAIRRASGGNESSNIYHRARYFQLLLMSCISALCLLLPLSIDFRAIVLPGAVLWGLLARCQWAFYKKHL